VAVQAANTL